FSSRPAGRESVVQGGEAYDNDRKRHCPYSDIRGVRAALITPGEAWPQSDWRAPAEAKTLKNPVKSIGDAKNAIAINCAGCHGARGRGDGVASAALQPEPMDWSSPAVHSERIRNTKALRVEDAEGQAVGAPANSS